MPTQGSPNSLLCALMHGTWTASTQQHLTLWRSLAVFRLSLKVTTQLKRKVAVWRAIFCSQRTHLWERVPLFASSLMRTAQTSLRNYSALRAAAGSTPSSLAKGGKKRPYGNGTDREEIRNIHPITRAHKITTVEPTNRETSESAVSALHSVNTVATLGHTSE